jgi:hypothetical protein
MILPGTLQQFQAPELQMLKLSIIASGTRFDATSVSGLLEDLHRFPVLDTFMVYAKCLHDGNLQFATHRSLPHLSVRNLSFGLSNPVPRSAAAAGHGSPFLSALLNAFPSLIQLTLFDLSYLEDSNVKINDDAVGRNLGIRELQIVSDADSVHIFRAFDLDGDERTLAVMPRGISEISWLLSSLSNVRSLKFGSDVGRYDDGRKYRLPMGHYGDVRPDSEEPCVIHHNLKFLFLFLIKGAHRQFNRTFLPNLELITLSKITLNENTLRALQNILELRAGPAKKGVRTPSTRILP